jgi:hypothetical protein
MTSFRFWLYIAIALTASTRLLSAQSNCFNVAGTITAHFTSATTVAGTVTGGLAGTVTAGIDGLHQAGDGALHVELHHTFVTANGQLNTVDEAVLSPVNPPDYRMDTRYTIMGGTGQFAGAAGILHNHGDANMGTGHLSLTYNGRICTP